MTAIAAKLQAVRERIARAARAAQRSPGEIVLVAASKTVPPEGIAQAYAAGQQAFGENIVQEAVAKITNLAGFHLEWHVARSDRENLRSRSDMDPSSGVASPEGPLLLPLEWHFIGPIQGNKTGPIAAHFQWVHGIERARIAQRLDAARPEGLPPLNVCIQVNVSGEATKSGVAPGGEVELAEIISRLPRLKLRGLMAIPEPTSDTSLQRRRFALLRSLKDNLVARGHALDTLSMGMSDDFEAAIAEGATMVRIGTAIFGPRKEK